MGNPKPQQDYTDLTSKQKRFIEEYLICLNQSEAAEKAGYSKNRKGEIGYHLINNPIILAEINKRKEERSIRKGIDADYVLTKLKNMSDAVIDDFVEIVDGKLKFKDFSQIPKEKREAISSIKMGKYGIEITFHNKSWTLDMIAKHIGLYEKDNDQRKTEPIQIIRIPDNGRDEINSEQTGGEGDFNDELA